MKKLVEKKDSLNHSELNIKTSNDLPLEYSKIDETMTGIYFHEIYRKWCQGPVGPRPLIAVCWISNFDSHKLSPYRKTKRKKTKKGKKKKYKESWTYKIEEGRSHDSGQNRGECQGSTLSLLHTNVSVMKFLFFPEYYFRMSEFESIEF